MTKKINIGVIGCANIADKYVLPALLQSANFNIVGIASRNKEKADDFAVKYRTKGYHSYENLLENPLLQAVYIPLPNSMHYEWISKSLEIGLHVLVEKSMACSYPDVLKLNNLAKEKNLVLIENFQFRFHSQLKYIKNLVDDGALGELRSLRSCFGFPPFQDKNNIRYNKNLGGGALYDAGAYPIKISQIFLGENLYADSADLSFSKNSNVDIWGSAFLKHREGGVAAQLAFGFDNFYQNSLELWGSKGKLFTNRIFTAPSEYEPVIELESEKGKKTVRLSPDHHFENMLNHFFNNITNRDNLISEYSQNINQARLISEILKCAV